MCFQATSMPYYSTICIVSSQVDNTSTHKKTNLSCKEYPLFIIISIENKI